MRKKHLFLFTVFLFAAVLVQAETTSLFDEQSIHRIAVQQASMAPAGSAPSQWNPGTSRPSVLIQDDSFMEATPDFEQNTSLKRFHINLGRNFLHLFDSRNLRPFLIGVGATGAFRSFDEEFHEYFGQENTRDFVANAGATLGKPYVLAPAIAGLLAAGRFSSDHRFRAYSYAMAQGLVLNTVTTLALKEAVGRTRPDGSNRASFPSGHSSDFFMFATITDSYYGHKAGIFAYGLASFVAFSRVKRDVHYMSDVIAGATLGYVLGRSVARTTGIPESKKITWAPIVNPVNRSYGISLAIRLP